MSFTQMVSPESWFLLAVAFGAASFLLKLNCIESVRFQDILFYDFISGAAFLCMISCFVTAMIQEAVK